MSPQSGVSREKKVREVAEVIYAENRKKGLPADPVRDWAEAERIYDNKLIYFVYWIPAHFIRKYFYQLIATCLLLIVFFIIADLKMGQDLADMTNRPYLSVDLINPMSINDTDAGGTYYGNYLILKNSGKTPAVNVTISYYMTTETDGKAAKGTKWSDQRSEGVSTLGFVAPGGFIKEPSFRSLSPSASYYYFEAVASYYGLNTRKHYWTQIKRVYKIDKDTKKMVPVFGYAEWDKDRYFSVPAISTEQDIWNMLAKIGNK